ncbi:hypothetical protein CKO13_12030 [Halorhodospira neutriphila]|uniref:Uncharacterized protein n=1 Tax=Halorhodospira neutriphila TaxID=168379 RepID=A0ABS1E9K1_9GAMM|nr:hypothetical protein [Halorhodospira neutriphila]
MVAVLTAAGGAQWLGAATGATDPLRPWAALTGSPQHAALTDWRAVDGGPEALERALERARQAQRPAVVEITAEWCAYCQKLEARTLPDPRVRRALDGAAKLRVDVTAMTDADRRLMQAHDVYLPPAILFFSAAGEERAEQRVVGFKGPEAFAQRARRALEP